MTDATTEKIAVKIGKSVYFAVFSEIESSFPNAMPTYRLYTKDGTYFMHMPKWQVEKHQISSK